MKNPWLKFYPTDLCNEKTLKICSWEARWLWVEMLRLMHEAEPYGHLLMNGKPLTDAHLAALTNTDASTISRLQTELESAGVFSRNAKGEIYSRRMTRDHKKSKQAKKNGKNGGNPRLCNKKTFFDPDNPEDMLNILEARSYNPEKEKIIKKEIPTLEALKNHDLNGKIQDFFEKEYPHLNRFKIRQSLVDYCESTGKKYKDYYAAMRTFAKNDKTPKPKNQPKNNFELQRELLGMK